VAFCSEFVTAPGDFAAFLHEPPFGRLCPECARAIRSVDEGSQSPQMRAAGSVTLRADVSGDQWIALAGVSSGAIVGVGGLFFAYFNGKAERAHGERLARSGRLHEQRAPPTLRLRGCSNGSVSSW
jgi:hypothetical protein